MSEGLIRPNGKRYKARKPPTCVIYNDSDHCEAVMVLRTHDFQLAIELAINLINEMDLDPTKASTDWVRLVPFDPYHSGYDTNWIEDPVRGTPCVVIPYG